MTPEKVKSVFTAYRQLLNEQWPGTEPRQMKPEEAADIADCLPWSAKVAHFKFMCDESKKFCDEGRIEKAMRWLGFLQGVLWNASLRSLDELKNDSLPDAPEEGKVE